MTDIKISSLKSHVLQIKENLTRKRHTVIRETSTDVCNVSCA